MKTADFRKYKLQQKCRKIFSRYDEGIRLSPQMLYSVTKEKIADKIAEYAAKRGFVYAVDGCGGAGGNSIAFARAGLEVSCVELDADNIEDAVHNAEIYGVADQIFFAQQDILEFDPFDGVEVSPEDTLFFASPEWGGPDYRNKEVYPPSELNPSLADLLEYARKHRFGGITVFAPRNIDLPAVEKMGCTECQYMFLEGWCDGVCLHFANNK